MYFEFSEPYYALIKSEVQSVHDHPRRRECVHIYERHITELPGDTDIEKYTMAGCKAIGEDEALYKFAKSFKGTYSMAKELFNKIPANTLVLADSALI